MENCPGNDAGGGGGIDCGRGVLEKRKERRKRGKETRKRELEEAERRKRKKRMTGKGRRDLNVTRQAKKMEPENAKKIGRKRW